MKKLFEEASALTGLYTTYIADFEKLALWIGNDLKKRGLKAGKDYDIDGPLITIAHVSDTKEVQELLRHWGIPVENY